jgi:hypothetical protein
MANRDWRRKATGSRAESPEFAGQRLGSASITRGNVGGSHKRGNRIVETALAGWAWRIRTSKCHFEARLLKSCCAQLPRAAHNGGNSRRSHIFSRRVLDFRCKQSVTVGAPLEHPWCSRDPAPPA